MRANQFKSKKYWIRVAGYFTWFVLTYTLISYVFKEADEPFWSLKEIQSRSIFALFMSLIFAYRHREQPASEIPDDTDMEKQPWNLKQFIGIFGLMLLFSIIIMSVLFGLGWVIMQIINKEATAVGDAFIRMLLVTVIMSFVAVLVLFLCEKFGIRWERKSRT